MASFIGHLKMPHGILNKKIFEKDALEQGFDKVSKHKLSVVKKFKSIQLEVVLFAMCSATDTYDIALSAQKTDICEYMFDGDPMDQNAQNKLDFLKHLLLKIFKLLLTQIHMSTQILM